MREFVFGVGAVTLGVAFICLGLVAFGQPGALGALLLVAVAVLVLR